MAKKKKNKKAKKEQKQARLREHTFSQLIQKAEAALSADKAREAVDCLKAARKKQDDPDTIRPLLFRAYLARIQQLKNKAMHTEASMAIEQASACRPEVSLISEEDLVCFVSLCRQEQAFEIYAQYIAENRPSKAIETRLVNRLIQSECWHLINRLDSESPLCRDAEAVPEAVTHMNRGEWENALEKLRSIPRSSPYAPLKMLCRAMCAFYSEEDSHLQKITNMLPGDFILTPVMSRLKTCMDNAGTAVTGDNEETIRVFFQGAVGASGKITELVNSVKKQKSQKAARLIKELGPLIYPENPEICISTLLEILSNRIRQGEMSSDFFFELITAVLPRKKALPIIFRVDLASSMPLNAASQYMEHIPRLFSEPRRQSIAKSLALFHAVKNSLKQDSISYEMDTDTTAYGFDVPEINWEHLGVCRQDPKTAYLQMARQGIAWDPENRQWYELIVTLPRTSKEGKNLVEDALNEMSVHFPQDPFPFLELTELYQQKSAFRKAEKAIEEAARRAPYDSRVIEKKAVSFLISAKINLGKDKHHLARRDIEKAEEQGCRKAALFVLEKRMALELTGENRPAEPDKYMDQMLAGLEPLKRVCTLCLLVMELSANKGENKAAGKALQAAKSGIKHGIKEITDLGADEMANLLDPVPSDLKRAMPSSKAADSPARVLPAREISRLIKSVEDEGVLNICDLLMEMGRYKTVRAELNRRIRGKKAAERPLIDFYRTVTADLTGETTDFDHLAELVENAGNETRRKLEAAADKLAEHALGPLNIALRFFDFEMFTSDYFFDDSDDDFFEDDFDDDIPFGPNISDNTARQPEPDAGQYYEGMSPQEIIMEIESLIDRMKFRGSPDYVLRTMRPAVHKSRPETKSVGNIILSFPPEIIEQLSREARILFLESS
ncbi:MAG: hypothetical protein K9J79_02665 [Desulfobacteraceae bacterium]|nr:hypothetical protein [Desulfobacteraceae bacterium]